MLVLVETTVPRTKKVELATDSYPIDYFLNYEVRNPIDSVSSQVSN